MLYTPAALELARRWPIFFSSVGEDDRPEMAESTFVSSAGCSDVEAAMMSGEVLMLEEPRNELMLEGDCSESTLQ